MRKRQKEEKQQFYVVLNQNGEVFSGLLGGYPNWSVDWSEAKPLGYTNTSMLKMYDSKIELIKEEEF
jgi:hypothetical protein